MDESEDRLNEEANHSPMMTEEERKALISSNKIGIYCTPPNSWQLTSFSTSFTFVTSGYRYLVSQHWHEILPGKRHIGPLFLGALPIESQLYWYFGDHGAHHLKLIDQFKALGHELGLVVSMNQQFELEGRGLTITPVSPQTWSQLKINQIICPMADFSNDIDLNSLKHLVDLIHDTRTNGFQAHLENGESKIKKGVLVHCKAGVARSMLVIMCYLCFYEDMSIEQAESYLRSRRSIVAITPEKKEIVKSFIEQFYEKKSDEESLQDPIHSPIQDSFKRFKNRSQDQLELQSMTNENATPKRRLST